MDIRGETSRHHKRLRFDNSHHRHGRHLPRFASQDKGKDIIEKEAILFVKIIRAVDIDRDFRSITNSRYYKVESWINPGEEFHTMSMPPDVWKSNLDPFWNERFIMPLRETSMEDATLHLDVLRDSEAVLDPGVSHMIKLVGKVQFRLDQLQPNRTVEVGLQLIQPRQFGWKPEGQLFLKMRLRKIPL